MKINHNADLIDSQTLAGSGVSGAGTPLYITAGGYFNAGSQYFVTRQGMPDYLLIHTLKGNGRLIHKEKSHQLLPESFIIVDCREYHDYRPVDGGLWVFEWVHFNGTAASYLVDKVGFSPIFDNRQFFRRLEGFVHSRIRDVEEYRILSDLLCRLIVLKERNESFHPLDALPEYMQENIAEPLSIEDMADHAGISMYHFIRQFKKRYGTTPMHYMTQLRINHSIRLLGNPSNSITQIAEACGFSDASSYIRCFKRFIGMPPTQYRRFLM